jgi:hypothetical protein
MRSFVLATAVIVTLTGCACGRSVQLVVPDGLQGEVTLVLDKANGVTIRPELFRYVIRFPASGELRTNDLKFLNCYRSYSARYANGTEARIVQGYSVAGARTTESSPLPASTEFDGAKHVWVIAAKSAR